MDRINTKEYKHMPFTAWLRFLAEATTPEKIGYGTALAHIKHSGDIWESTDGHRLHRVISDEFPVMEDGYYEIVKSTKAETILLKAENQGIDWPNTEAPWPKHENFEEIAGNQSWLYTDLVRKLPEGFSINYQYVNCLFSFSDFWTAYIYDGEWTSTSNGEWTRFDAPGIRFVSEPMCALIMPLSK